MTKTIFLATFAVAALAQSVPSYTPPVLEKAGMSPAAQAALLPSRRARLGLPRERWLPPVTAQERAGVRVKDGLTAAGIHRTIDSSVMAGSEWTQANGQRVWRLSLVSPGATAVRVHFRDFAVGDGQVWLHNDDPADPQVSGPYAGKGMFGDGEFWAAPVHGQRAVIEYVPGNGAEGQLPFEIDQIAHLWDPIVEASASREAALPCMIDISCHPDWAARASSVARIEFEVEGGSALCSGTLLGTPSNSGIPFFATANHCVSTPAEARTVIAYWGFQTARCNGAPPALNSLPRSSGATLLASVAVGEGPDFTLLRLNSVPQGVTFAGWNASEMPVGTDVTGMHHPAGDFRRVSFGTRIDDQLIRGLHPTSFYSIQWSQGTTEGGSSGSGIFNAAGQFVGTLFGAPKPPAGKTKCDIIPNFSWYGKFSVAFPLVRQFLEAGGGGTPQPPAPSGGGTLLTSGQPFRFSLVEVSQPTLYTGTNGFRVVVPQNATRLEINLGADPGNVDVDLFASRNTEPSVANGRIVADHRADGPTGNESLVITPGSNPPLQAGTYYIAVAVLTTGAPVNLSITATVSTAAPPAPTGAIALTSGQPRQFTIEPVLGPTLVGQQFRLDVPQGAGRVEFRLESATANVDLDLYVRRGNPIELSGGRPVYDYASTTALSNEIVTITTGSSPPLSPGTYYVAVGIFTTGIRVNASITARVETGGGPAPSGIPLLSGNPTVFTLSPVPAPRLLNGGDQVYLVNVPQGATRFEVRLELTTARADVDFFVRRGSVPTLDANGRVVSDHRSELFDGVKTLVVTPSSTPALAGGTYFIALGVNTTGVAISGRITASTVGGTPGGSPPPAAPSPVTLNNNSAQAFNLDPVTGPTLFNAQPFRIEVPQGASRLRIQLNTTTPNVDVSVFGRYDASPSAPSGTVVSDHSATGSGGVKTLVIDGSSTPPLRAGTYYIALAVFTANTRVQGTITAAIEAAAARPTQATVLTSGSPAKYSLPAVTEPTLFRGEYGFRIVVPEGATNLNIRLNTVNAADVDVDLYVRKDADIDIGDDIIADYFSEGPDGNESIVINRDSSPPLGPGTYYIGFALFTPGRDVNGTLTATFERAPTATPGPAPGAVGTLLTPGVPAAFRMPPVTGGTFFGGNSHYRVEVTRPGRLELRLRTTTPGADTDLFARYGQTMSVGADGRVVSDFSSTGDTGDETIVIPAARVGTYYVALALFTPNIEVTGTLTAVFTPSESGLSSSRYQWKVANHKSRLAEKAPVDKGPLVEWNE